MYLISTSNRFFTPPLHNLRGQKSCTNNIPVPSLRGSSSERRAQLLDHRNKNRNQSLLPTSSLSFYPVQPVPSVEAELAPSDSADEASLNAYRVISLEFFPGGCQLRIQTGVSNERCSVAFLLYFLATASCACQKDPVASVKSKMGLVGGKTSLPLIASPNPTSFGKVYPSHVMSRFIQITNVAEHDVSVEMITASCSCVKFLYVPSIIHPGEKMKVEIVLDTSEESNFRGTLAVEILGIDKGSNVVLRTEARVTIVGAEQ